MTTDERRARWMYGISPILNEGKAIPWDSLTLFHKDRYFALARAIHKSDEAAGMVQAPRVETYKMASAGCGVILKAISGLPREIQDAIEDALHCGDIYRAMIAAHEGESDDGS